MQVVKEENRLLCVQLFAVALSFLELRQTRDDERLKGRGSEGGRHGYASDWILGLNRVLHTVRDSIRTSYV